MFTYLTESTVLYCVADLTVSTTVLLTLTIYCVFKIFLFCVLLKFAKYTGGCVKHIMRIVKIIAFLARA